MTIISEDKTVKSLVSLKSCKNLFDTIAKFMKIKAANAIAQIIRDNTYDALFMAAAKKNGLLIQETIRVIQSVKDQELTQFQLGHLCSFVTRLLKGTVFHHFFTRFFHDRKHSKGSNRHMN